MDYRSYHIIAEVRVNEGWDFTEDSQGLVHITTFLYRGKANSIQIEGFTIEDENGSQIDEYPDTLVEAKEIIDKLIEEK